MDARARIDGQGAVARLAARDASLFADPETAAQRLGWVGLAAASAASVPALSALTADVCASGITDVVLLGMGGSSLAPLVLARTVPPRHGCPRLHVLDTTSPVQVDAHLKELWPSSTLVVVSSKSGSTVEPMSLAAVFRSWMDPMLGPAAGERFIAVTDPGSPLEAYANAHGFAAVFHAPADVGGRYSALTPFGTVPAALAGIDVAALLEAAATAERACADPGPANPASGLAAWLADAYEAGRDKLTIVASRRWEPFGLWVEQLIAESTGKGGRGLLPVLEASPGDPASHGDDRAVFVLRGTDDEELAALPSTLPPGTPVLEHILDTPADVAGEFVVWEWACALFSMLAGIEPFDQPDVAVAKSATQAILVGERFAPAPQATQGLIAVTTDLPWAPVAETASVAQALSALLRGAEPGDYVAILAYLPDDERLLAPLRGAAAAVARSLRIPVVVQLGPRYLHSTGQYHKGGPSNGRFLIVTARDEVGPSIPGARYTLAQLNRAQAEGDYLTLAGLGRPVVRVDLPLSDPAPVRLLAETLRGAAG